MYGNHCHFSKGPHVLHVFCILAVEQGVWRLCSFWPLSNFVAVEMTSHQNSPLPFESMPAWISMALALPINVGILLSATEFC